LDIVKDLEDSGELSEMLKVEKKDWNVRMMKVEKKERKSICRLFVWLLKCWLSYVDCNMSIFAARIEQKRMQLALPHLQSNILP
jgi:hypothetical protein